MAHYPTRAGHKNTRTKNYSSNSSYRAGNRTGGFRVSERSDSRPSGGFSRGSRSGGGFNRGSRPGGSFSRGGRPGGFNRDRGGNSRFGSPRRSGGGRPKGDNIARHLYINDLQQEAVTEKQSYQGKPYTQFGLNPALARNLNFKGFEFATEIQDKAIPLISSGQDVLGISSTGSGKTGAFLIPLVNKLLADRSQRLLVVAPTRELAQQIAKEGISMVKGTELQIAVVIGGESMGKQLSQLRKGARIVISTPGRLHDLIKRGDIKPDGFNNIVIDEVDRMMDMGFIKDIKQIFELIAAKRQALFFSATLNRTVEKTVAELSSNFQLIKLAENKPSKSVVQSVIDYSSPEEKFELLLKVLKRQEVEKAIVFVETKHYADKVDKVLKKNNFETGAIHGNKRQNARKKVIDLFKNSRINVLVATNVAARGIDINDITHVINFDEPQTYDEYIHRIGRAGRNGSLGTAYTFVKK